MDIGNVTFDRAGERSLSAFWSRLVHRPVAAHEQHEFGIGWMTSTDPEGDELCVGEH